MEILKAKLKTEAFCIRVILFLGCIFSLLSYMWFGGPQSEKTEIDLYLFIFVPSFFLGFLILLMSEQILFELEDDYLVFSETPGFWDQKSNSKVPISEVTEFRVQDGWIHFKVFGSEKRLRIEEYDCIKEDGSRVSWQRVADKFPQGKIISLSQSSSAEYLQSLRKRKLRGRVVTVILILLSLYKIYNKII